MARTLLLLRHAKSDWSRENLKDHQRPLNQRGKKAAPKMGRRLAEAHLVPDLIISSDAVRAMQTAQAVAKACDYEGEILSYERLYLAEPDTYLEVLLEVPPELSMVMMVGHNPGISALATALTKEPCEMPTAALCRIEWDTDAWSEVHSGNPGELLDFWKPRDL